MVLAATHKLPNGEIYEYYVTPQKLEEIKLKNRIKMRKYTQDHKEENRKRSQDWRDANRERFREMCRENYRKNKERVRLKGIKWRKENMGAFKASQAKRRARERNATVPLTKEERGLVSCIYSMCRRLNECTTLEFHVDHIIPLSKGGLHHPENLQILPKNINLMKATRLDFDAKKILAS